LVFLSFVQLIAQWQTNEQSRGMGSKSFAGNAGKRLPKGKTEPYRLWFEYLKLALRIPEIKVDKSLYRSWGGVQHEDFDTWWSRNWSDLFAMEPGTKVLTTVAEAKDAFKDPTAVVLRVSLAETKKRRVMDINDALRKLPRSTRPRKSPFELSSKRSINLKTLRAMLKFYTLYEDNNRDIEATSIAYLKWSRAWNEKVQSKNWNRPRVYQPPFLNQFVNEIVGGEKRPDLRSQARRFLRKGEKVLRNVAIGKFPGPF
jgi:hypothetical protein